MMENDSLIADWTPNSTNTTEHPNEEMARLLWTIFPPILIPLGTVGNILTILVLTRRTLRRSYVPNLPTYLTCLAFSDLLVLYIGLLRQWVVYVFDLDIRDLHPAVCKIHQWLVYTSLDMSAWLLVSVTVERAMSVLTPYKVRVICTQRLHLTTMCLMAVILLLVNSHFLFSCQGESDQYRYFSKYIFPWIDLFFFSVGPFILHIVGNAVIITRMLSGYRCMSLLTMATTEQKVGRQRQVSSMTTTLLCLNLVYLISTLPISLFFIHAAYQEGEEPTPQQRLIFALTNLLMYLNNSTNFVTYTLSAKRFRQELRNLIFGRRHSFQTARTS